MSVPPRVIKIGGSLLDWPRLATRFRAWLALEPPASSVIVTGGGRIVDAVRSLDRTLGLAPATAHWLAIRAMSLTATIVAELIAEATLIKSLDQLPFSPTGGLWILDVEQTMRADARASDGLPCTWDATSDAIAARVARCVEAGELVLLKSALPDTVDRVSWSESGYVDACFVRSAAGLPVRCVNLRHVDFPQVVDAGIGAAAPLRQSSAH